LSGVERFISANTPSLLLRRYWRHLVGIYFVSVILGGVAGYVLNGETAVTTARLVATVPYWGLGWFVEQSPVTLFGVAAVLLAGYALLEYYTPERFFEGSYVSMVWPLMLTGIVLSAIVWAPAYLKAVVGVSVPSIVASPSAALLVLMQVLVGPILIRLVWSDKTRLLDRSLHARAEEAGDVSSMGLLRVARDRSIPLTGESFRPVVWLYLGWLSVISFGIAIVFEDVLLASLPTSVALILIGMPTVVSLGYLMWRTLFFARTRIGRR
jgi:hypothetical protein